MMLQRNPSYEIEARVAPPPPRFEPMPETRAGFAWIPGYWNHVDGRGFVWVVGRWIPERRGCHWRRHRWVLRGDAWHLEPGRWMPG